MQTSGICKYTDFIGIHTMENMAVFLMNGFFISYKSGEIEEELKESEYAIQTLGGELEDVVKFQLPETEIHRSFVKIRKKRNTAKKYPRKAGLPSKEPIKRG